MEIKSVTYRRLTSFGQYEHAAIEATAAITDGEVPEEALDCLRRWVQSLLDEEIATREQARRAQHEASEASYQLQRLDSEIERARQKWERIQAFFERLGVHPKIDDIPF